MGNEAKFDKPNNREEDAVGSLSPQAPSLATPWITYSIIAICSVIYLFGLLQEEDEAALKVLEFLAPTEIDIWSGAVWGLLTTAFVHGGPLHFLFNMWWARDFGRVLEPTMRRAPFGWLVILSACVVTVRRTPSSAAVRSVA